MFGWLKNTINPDVGPAAKEIADAFLNDNVHAEIKGFGLDKISVRWKGHTIRAIWYTGTKNFAGLVVDGAHGYPEGADCNHIFRAALLRADQLTAERLSKLNEDAAA